MSLSFWLKMLLIGVGASLAVGFQRTLGRHDGDWEAASAHHFRARWLGIVTLLVWCSIVILGRLIAYDYVWGSWSPAANLN
jgi:hypothetical protein